MTPHPIKTPSRFGALLGDAIGLAAICVMVLVGLSVPGLG